MHACFFFSTLYRVACGANIKKTLEYADEVLLLEFRVGLMLIGPFDGAIGISMVINFKGLNFHERLKVE